MGPQFRVQVVDDRDDPVETALAGLQLDTIGSKLGPHTLLAAVFPNLKGHRREPLRRGKLYIGF